MKRFIIAACAAVLLLFGALYMIYGLGFYIDLRPGAGVTALFRTDGRKILRLNGGGDWEEFELRGVDVVSNLPGEFVTDYAPEAEDYLRWFEQISEMGANTIRAYTVMDSDFYEALYLFNTSHPLPLYLLQGLQVSDSANYGAGDIYDSEFMDLLLKNARAAVDAVHGRKFIALGDVSGSGYYRRDISEWVVGYLVGHEWDSGNMAYANESTLYPVSYTGKYFTTAADATRFEAAMARVMDELTEYETSKYKTQRLVGFINGALTDPFEYTDLYAARAMKYVQLDAEHVLPTDQLLSGYFAAYRLTPMRGDFAEYLTVGQRARLAGILSGLDTSDAYHGYLNLLSEYHSMPVVAAYGFSTSRVPTYEMEPPLTEAEQGEALVRVWRGAVDAGWSGVLISTWQDVWDRRTWNTSYSTYEFREPTWQDVQAEGQCYGLMEFGLGEEQVCLVDGDTSDWAESDLVSRTDAGALYMKYDEKYIYFYAERADYDPLDGALYIPIDTTPNSGSTYCENFGLGFDRAADFVICIDGLTDSRILVQEAYDVFWVMHAYDVTREDAFTEPREPDSPMFQPILVMVELEDIVSAEQWVPAATYETGKLTFGSANPQSGDYNSLADYMFTENGVEIRVPWQMLNFSCPAEGRIHDDYYEHYGVQSMRIDGFHVGLALEGSDSRVRMYPVPLETWGSGLPYRERLKESYYILQAHWAEN